MSANQTVRTGGVSLCTLLTVAFVILKLCKVIDWSWWWVLAPLWGPWALAFVVMGLLGLVVVFCKVVVTAIERRSK